MKNIATVLVYGVAIAISVLAIVLMNGCAAVDVGNAVPFMAHPLTTKELTVQESPGSAYDRAVKTIMGMGGVITQLQPETYRISAQMYGAVAFNVVITEAGTGSTIQASQRVADGYVAYAPVRVCERFFEAYMKGNL